MRSYKRLLLNDDPLAIARYRVEKIRRFFIHLFIYLIGITIYILKTYFNVRFNFIPIHFINFTFMAIWTLIIAIQGMKLFIREVAFGSNWEQQKIQKIMNEQQQKQNWE